MKNGTAKLGVLLLAAVVFCAICLPAVRADALEPRFLEDKIVKTKGYVYGEIRETDFNIKYAWCLGESMSDRYPYIELIEIDGVPWQDSPYAEIIKEYLTYYGEAGVFGRYPEMLEIVLDKRFNGRGVEAMELYKQGKSIAEIKETLLSGGGAQDKPGLKEPPSPEPGGVSVVLYVDKKEYSVARDGVWRSACMDVAPVVVNGRTLIPLRGVMEQFGAEVKWVPESRQVEVRHGGREVVLVIGSTKATVDGRAVELDVPAKIVEGRTLVPLRFVLEQIGMDVKWDGQTRSITISSAVSG